MRFDGTSAIVTGAANGIGEATAKRLAAEGAAVLLVDTSERGEEVTDEILRHGGKAAFKRADVADEADADACVGTAVDTFGRLDVLVSNAAITLPKGYLDTTPAEWDHVLAVNLRSVFHFLRAATPHLVQARGSVVNVASFHATATIENFAAYAAAKTGVLGLTRSACLDLAARGVRVNAVCPGIIETAMWRTWLEQVDDVDQTIAEVTALQPLGRIGTPDEVAAAIVFLASNDASYITGTALFVDGGVTARLSHV